VPGQVSGVKKTIKHIESESYKKTSFLRRLTSEEV
jgi:hypothetical protein